MNTAKAFERIRALAPEEFAADWDNSRVQVRGEREEIKKLAVALDPATATMRECLSWGADLVVTHHPLYFQPQAPTTPGQHLDVLRLFLSAGAWLYAAHTSLDCRPDGPAFWLGRALKLKDCKSLERVRSIPAREFFFQAPAKFTEREAKQLVDLPGIHAMSQTATGEIRVVCDESAWSEISEQLKGVFANKPLQFYVRRLEEPAVSVGYGQVGDLPGAMGVEEFSRMLEKTLFEVQSPCGVTGAGITDGKKGPKGLAWAECGPRPDTIRRVAYCTGSGASLIPAAFAAGADVFICGDVKHHAAMETPGLVFDVGHYILEEEMMRLFAGELQKDLGRGVEVRFFAGKSPFSFRVLA